MRLIVFVVSWQLEEDGAILQVGQEVEWWLAFHDASWWPQEPDEHVQHLSAVGRPIDWEGTERVRFPTELTADMPMSDVPLKEQSLSRAGHRIRRARTATAD